MSEFSFNYKELEKQGAEIKLRKGSRYSKLDCKNLVKELDIIEKEYNGIEDKYVVDYARNNPNSEFHKGLEWNDQKAAEKYRKQQVHQIISDIVIVYTDNSQNNKDKNKDTKVVIVPYYSHLPSESGYKTTIEVIKNTDTRKELLQKATNELLYWQQKYRHLEEFTDIFDVIEKHLNK